MTAPALAACPRVASRRSCQYASCAALLVQTTTASKPCEPSISFTVAAMRRPFSVVFLRFVPDVGDVMMSDRLPRIGCNRRDYSDRRCAVPMGAAGFDAWTGAVRCDDRCGRLHAMRRGGIGGETSARLALWALRRGRTSEEAALYRTCTFYRNVAVPAARHNRVLAEVKKRFWVESSSKSLADTPMGRIEVTE